MRAEASPPIHLRVDRDDGALVGRTSVKCTRSRDLGGLHADGDAFARLAAERGDDIACTAA
jgi:hypothetical protein